MIWALIRALRGWFFGIVVLLTATFGSYIVCLFFPILLIGMNDTWRHNMDRAISFWMTIPMFFLEYVFGVTIRVSGDPIDYEQPAMILMNHRTRLDWMYIWSALYQMNPWLITSNKISMKKELKFLPGAGFGMSANQFIFLERSIEKDRESFESTIDYYVGTKNNYQVLLFPEGTDKTDWTTAKSNSFAKKNGLNQLEYVLYPRVAGFYHLLNKMRQENYITHIYDITIGYPYKTVQTEIHLVAKGEAPKEVHFHVRKIPISEVPRTEAAAGAWLTKLWLEKEERLRKFYSEPRHSYRRFESKGFSWNNRKESWKKRLTKIFAAFIFVFVALIWIYHLTFVRFLQIGFLYCILVQSLTGYFFGGIDRFTLYKWRKSMISAKN